MFLTGTEYQGFFPKNRARRFGKAKYFFLRNSLTGKIGPAQEKKLLKTIIAGAGKIVMKRLAPLPAF
jgi:hypothetical protein